MPHPKISPKIRVQIKDGCVEWIDSNVDATVVIVDQDDNYDSATNYLDDEGKDVYVQEHHIKASVLPFMYRLKPRWRAVGSFECSDGTTVAFDWSFHERVVDARQHLDTLLAAAGCVKQIKGTLLPVS